jgi:hypothetical protein
MREHSTSIEQNTQSIRANPQTARAVLMVRPARFAWNPQTARNRFRRGDESLAAAAAERLRRIRWPGRA